MTILASHIHHHFSSRLKFMNNDLRSVSLLKKNSANCGNIQRNAFLDQLYQVSPTLTDTWQTQRTHRRHGRHTADTTDIWQTHGRHSRHLADTWQTHGRHGRHIADTWQTCPDMSRHMSRHLFRHMSRYVQILLAFLNFDL